MSCLTLSEKITPDNIIMFICCFGFVDYKFTTENLSHKFGMKKIEQELKDIFIIRSKIQDAVFSGLCCINLFNQSFENHPNSKLLVCSLKMDEFPLMKITLKQLTCSVHPLIISYISPKALLISIL